MLVELGPGEGVAERKDDLKRRKQVSRQAMQRHELTEGEHDEQQAGGGEPLQPRHLLDQVAMYARSACASCAVSLSFTFTRSPIDTSPSSFPSSITGRWRKRRSVINPSASSTDIESSPTTTLHVIRASTVSVSKSRSPSAYRRTTSRSVKTPTGHPSASGTITAPTFSACMMRIASATLDLADTVTTW